MLQFGTGVAIATQLKDAQGNVIANATPVQFATLQDISIDASFEEKMLYGANQFPVAVGRGKGKLTGKAKFANITGQLLGDLFFGVPANAAIAALQTNFSAPVPTASPYTIALVPPNSGSFVQDLGVTYLTSGLPLKKVGNPPTVGQYAVSNLGVYTFAAADAATNVLLNYAYSATSSTARTQTISNLAMGYAPSFSLAMQTTSSGKNLTLVLNNCLSSKLALSFKNDDFVIPEFEFTALADAAGNVGYWATSE